MGRLKIAHLALLHLSLLFLIAINPIGGDRTLAESAAPEPQQCVINGGTNNNIFQYCLINPAPAPLVMLADRFETIQLSDKTYNHSILVKINGPIDMELEACGVGVLDALALPFPGGMFFMPQTATNPAPNCVVKRYTELASGRWTLEVKTKDADTKFTLKPIPEPLP